MIPSEQDVERQSSMFELDEAHREFQVVCRAFVQQQVRPLVEQSELSGEFPHALWQLLGRHGFLGLGYPDDVSGSGGDNLSIALLSEELAKTSGGIAVTPLVILCALEMLNKSTHFFPLLSKERALPPSR